MRTLWIQTKYEFLKLFRMPAYFYSLLMMPCLFYLPVLTSNRYDPFMESIPTPVYNLATLGTFAAFGIALFGLGVGSAIERGQGWLRTLRPAPVSPLVPILAKIILSFLLTVLAVLILFAIALAFGKLDIDAGSLIRLLLVLMASSIPLACVGLALGAWVKPNSAPILMIMIYLPVSSISGIVVPISMVAKGMPLAADIAAIWPTYHAGQLALAAVREASIMQISTHIAALVVVCLVFTRFGLWAYRKNAAESVG